MKLLFVLCALMISASTFAGSISLNGGRISDGAGNGGKTLGSDYNGGRSLDGNGC